MNTQTEESISEHRPNTAVQPNHTLWEAKGVFVSDCQETLAKMWIIREGETPVAATWERDVRTKIVRAVNNHEELIGALKALYLETADYIRLNNLYDVHHNHSMQLAHEALKKAGAL